MVRMSSQSTVNEIDMRLRKKGCGSSRKLLGGQQLARMIPPRRHVIMSSCHHVVKDFLSSKQSREKE